MSVEWEEALMSRLGPAELVEHEACVTQRYPHPNDVDRKRIERALDGRKRYRYVTPEVTSIASGYEIRSPCCSRRIDQAGGVVPIARLLHSTGTHPWQVYRKDHALGVWELHAECSSLARVLELILEDPDQSFWQ
jgi:hypothetical protein